jgi:hypothetical protein
LPVLIPLTAVSNAELQWLIAFGAGSDRSISLIVPTFLSMHAAWTYERIVPRHLRSAAEGDQVLRPTGSACAQGAEVEAVHVEDLAAHAGGEELVI